MRSLTCSSSHCGVDAPAVNATLSFSPAKSLGTSSGVSTRMDFGQRRRQVSSSFCVLELVLSADDHHHIRLSRQSFGFLLTLARRRADCHPFGQIGNTPPENL